MCIILGIDIVNKRSMGTDTTSTKVEVWLGYDNKIGGPDFKWIDKFANIGNLKCQT